MLFLNEHFIGIISAWLVAKQALKFKSHFESKQNSDERDSLHLKY